MKSQSELLTKIHTVSDSIETLIKVGKKKQLRLAVKKLVDLIRLVELG